MTRWSHALCGARELALGRADRDAGHVARLLALEHLAAHLDLLAAQVDDQAVERGALAVVLVAQLRAVERRERRRPCGRVSPALRVSVTVPAAGAYSVGLTAATTVACAATSLRNSPRVTVAIRTRSRAIEVSDVAQPRSAPADDGQQQQQADAAPR